jgi:uncharacterized membrane protein
MPLYLLAFLIGVVAGLRSMMPPAAVSWAARLGWLHLENTPLAFLGFAATPYILSLFAIAELIKKTLVPFTARIVTGAFSGAALGAPIGGLAGGLVAGAAGGVAGTLAGYEFRRRLVKATGGKDLPIALLEDAIAICVAFWIVSRAAL